MAVLRGLLAPLERKNGWQLAEADGDATPDGWRAEERFQGCAVRLERVAGGVRVVMSAAGGEATVWTVPAAGGG